MPWDGLEGVGGVGGGGRVAALAGNPLQQKGQVTRGGGPAIDPVDFGMTDSMAIVTCLLGAAGKDAPAASQPGCRRGTSAW